MLNRTPLLVKTVCTSGVFTDNRFVHQTGELEALERQSFAYKLFGVTLQSRIYNSVERRTRECDNHLLTSSSGKSHRAFEKA